jgi:hypothetical protein
MVFWKALRDGSRAWVPMRAADTRSVAALDRDI